MPGIFTVMLWIAAILAGTASVVAGALHLTRPDPEAHQAITQACNGPTEINAVISSNPAAVTALKGAAASASTVVGADGTMPIVARVVSGQYVVTIGSGSNAKTCLVPLATSHL
jgi:ABC-type xylose transport system substrate-binding protein